MRLLVDRCAGRKLADWPREQGHDALEVRTLGRDPGAAALLRQAPTSAASLWDVVSICERHRAATAEAQRPAARQPA